MLKIDIFLNKFSIYVKLYEKLIVNFKLSNTCRRYISALILNAKIQHWQYSRQKKNKQPFYSSIKQQKQAKTNVFCFSRNAVYSATGNASDLNYSMNVCSFTWRCIIHLRALRQMFINATELLIPSRRFASYIVRGAMIGKNLIEVFLDILVRF